MSLVWTFSVFLLDLKRLFLVILLVHSSGVCVGVCERKTYLGLSVHS